MTVSVLLQNAQKKELYSKLKKNYSVIQNVLKKGQLEEGIQGSNTAIFTPGNTSFETSKKFSKYLNTVLICENEKQTECSEIMKNYEIKYNTDLKPVKLTLPFTVLADGSLYMIRQSSTNKGETCSYTHYDCIRDSAGHCVKDKNGNETPNNWVAYNCGSIIFDVNGIQKPNKYKHDVYEIKIYENYTEFTDWKPMHLKKEVEDILSDKY